ncbi:protein ABHD11-like [Uloborus diversus]|uniref:protein ABHD11-like n=1 Tax=Uloborus diversus TaxID=327109 RepID=UPI002409E597|nr:protein ABHD11-like [Uloborus diversus]XP_054723569.1 protein ABHD11-like [Uloborus diversus]
MIDTTCECSKMKLAFEVHVPLTDRRTDLAPVLLIHGMMESRRTWKNVAPYIASYTKRKVLAVDLRNHGETAWSKELNFEVMREDIEEFLSYHNIPKAIVIGHSLGGIIAMSFALKYPHKVEMLILEDTYTKKLKPAPDGVVAQLLNGGREALNVVPEGADLTTAKECIRKFLFNLCPEELADKSKEENYSLDMMPFTIRGNSIQWQGDLEGLFDMVSTNKIEHELNGVYGGDTMFLYGSLSFYKIYKDKRIPQLFPKAILRKVEGASHFIHSEKPDIFVNEVVNFIQEHTENKSKY